MDHHIKEFYRQSSGETPRGHFQKVINLNEDHEISWQTVHELVPRLCKGWFELARLTNKDRIEFTRDYWITRLPYGPESNASINNFFQSLDDIAIFITQGRSEDPHEAQLVYSIKNDSGFFRGGLPANEQEIIQLQRYFSNFILPADYLAFLQIHDGFSKTTDCTGITKSTKMPETYQKFQVLLQNNDPIVLKNNRLINPKTLIPFYESFGMPYYQCFWADWYPESEMGNVYYSGEANTISDVDSGGASSEIMSFATFLDWLMFYLERFV